MKKTSPLLVKELREVSKNNHPKIFFWLLIRILVLLIENSIILDLLSKISITTTDSNDIKKKYSIKLSSPLEAKKTK